MTWLIVALVLVVAAAGLLRWRRPAWYWLTFGVTLAALRVLVRYGSVMDACGLTVPAPRWRLALARMTNRPVPGPRAPRILRVRVTWTGLVLRLKLRPGQDAFDVAASCDRLRHSFAMYGVTSRELRSGVVELRMTGYDVLKRVQMPAVVDSRPMRVPVALREDGAVHYRDYRAVPHALTLGATESGKSVYQRNLVAALASQHVALVGIDCKQGVELFPLARRFSALADNPDTASDLLDALVSHMEEVYQLIRAEQRITADVPDAEIAADIWDLPEDLRPVPIVVLVDEVAELALFATKEEEKRRDRIITALARLAQLGRAAKHLSGDLRAALRLRTRQGHHHAPRPAHRPYRPPRQRRIVREHGPRRHRPGRRPCRDSDLHRHPWRRHHRRLDRRLGPYPCPAHVAAPGREHLQQARQPDPGPSHPGPVPARARHPHTGSGPGCRVCSGRCLSHTP